LRDYGLDVGQIMTSNHVSDGAITLKYLDEEIFEDAAFFGDIPNMHEGPGEGPNCPDLVDRTRRSASYGAFSPSRACHSYLLTSQTESRNALPV